MSSFTEFELFGASGYDINQAGMKFERWAVERGIDVPDMDEDEAVSHYDDYATTLMEEHELDDDELTQEMFMVCKYYGSCFGVWYDERSQDSVDCPEYDEWLLLQIQKQEKTYKCSGCDTWGKDLCDTCNECADPSQPHRCCECEEEEEKEEEECEDCCSTINAMECDVCEENDKKKEEERRRRKVEREKEEKCIVPDCYEYGIIEWKAMDGNVCRECCLRINKEFAD